MVDGVHTLDGPLAQLLVEVVAKAEQGLVTTHHRLMGVKDARLMVQATLRRNLATQMYAQHQIQNHQQSQNHVNDCWLTISLIA